MPEGDSAYQTASLLDRALTGRTLTAVDLRVPRLATVDLAGAFVTATVARGKHLLTRLRDDAQGELTLHTHLRMDGSWRVYRGGRRWDRPGHTARAVLTAGDVQAVGFALGVVELLRTIDEATVLGHLGPDLLGTDWDEDAAVRRLLEHPDRPLRSALLDQTRLAGIGNVYAAEVCFLAGLDPETPVGSVPDLRRLVGRARQLLQHNRDRPVRVTTGDRREPLWVYGRAGRPCRRCGATILRRASGDAAGQERVSFWCPACQPPVKNL